MTENAATAPQEAALAVEPESDAARLSQWQLIRRRFFRNRLAKTGVITLVVMYAVIILGEFLAPNDYMQQNPDYVLGAPSPITFFGPDGRFSLRPYTYQVTGKLDPKTFKFIYTFDKEHSIPLKLFVRGDSYQFLGLFKTNVHLYGVDAPNRLYPLGSDALGRDVLARIIVGGQVSLTVGLVGVAMTIILGSVIGTASGYYAGWIDTLMQRGIEVIMSFPTVPLWAALAAALPPTSEHFTGIHRYFLITVILSLIGWTGLARQLRAKVMSYRESDFCQAALAAGASDARIIFVHMLPNAASHIIVVAALGIPTMILGETTLSFLGLGIQAPLVSWGTLLQSANQVTVVVEHPWLLLPVVAVVIAVLGYSFLGDGLRDAVDPYSI